MRFQQFTTKALFSLLILMAALFFTSACTSTKPGHQQHKADFSVKTLAASVSQNPDEANINQLKNAYNEANANDIAKIQELKISGQPDIWETVYHRYTAMQERQEIVGQLPGEIREHLAYKPNNYKSDLQYAREKTAAYYYALAEKKFQDSSFKEQNQGYQCLLKIQEIYPGFRDVQKRVAEYKAAMPEIFSYEIINNYPNTLPPGVRAGLENIDLAMFDSPKYRFSNQEAMPLNSHYKIQLIIKDIKIQPEKKGELAFTETVKIQDGLAYQLDSEGDFALDESGNKIEVPKLKTLVCYVNQYKQEKSILMLGEFRIIDAESLKPIAKQRAKGESEFTNVYAKFKGDLDALSPESFKLVGSKEEDYPSDENMIMHAGERFAQDAVLKVLRLLEDKK